MLSRAGQWIGLLGIATLAGWLLRENRLDLMAPERGGTYTYADGTNQGHSRISLASGKFGWRAAIQLAPGFAFPYVAAGVRLAKGSKSAVVDATGFDSLVLELRSRRQKTVRIYLKSFDPSRTDTLRDLSYPVLEGGVGVDREWSRRSIALRSFAIPLWWFQVNNLAPGQPPDWIAHLSSVDLLNGGMETSPDLQDTLEVRRLELVGTRWTPMLLSLLVACGLGLGVETWVARRRRNLSPAKILATGNPVDLPLRQDLERDALLSWISANYAREDLTVEAAGRDTGIHPRKVAGILKTAVGRTFPAHVNELRLTESARLLRETDRTVAEIAAAVGVSNVPHFHRMFKARYGATPKEWRSQAV